MASARHLPSTYDEYTYGGVARDYSSFATWEADTDIDCVASAKGIVLSGYSDSPSFNDSIHISGATCNASFFRVVRAVSGCKHNGTPNSGFKIEYTATIVTAVIQVTTEDYMQFHDLIVTATAQNNANNGAAMYTDGGSSEGALIGCIFKGWHNSGGGDSQGVRFQHQDPGRWFAIDCLSFGFDWDGFFNVDGKAYLYNCTAADNGRYGIYEWTGGTCLAVNCIGENNSTDDFAGGVAQTTCCDGCGITFADSANYDYSLTASDSGNGTDMSSDPVHGIYPFDDDAVYELWESGNWGRGFIKYTESANGGLGSGQKVIMVV